MAFCRNCGEKVTDTQTICVKCGARVVHEASSKPEFVDEGGFGWSVLGFCVPLVGLVLYLVWKDERPYTASAAGTGAIIGFIVGVFLGFIRLLLM